MIRFVLIVFCASFVLKGVYSDAAVNQDSYLNALTTSHQSVGTGVEREDYNDFNPDYHAGYDYQPAKQHHGPPPPPLPYGPPVPVYGPPKPIYGPPLPHYGPPHHPQPFYHPRETWFLDKFKFKLDLFTVGKLLLKLIIFKKIVKFIALICLLLFLPKLHHGKDDDDDDHDHDSGESKRSFGDKENLNQRLNEVTNFALTAFETFSKKDNGCQSGQVWCRFERMFDTVDAKYPYEKIVKLYLPDANIDTNEIGSK